MEDKSSFQRTLNCTYFHLWRRNGTTTLTVTEVATDLSEAIMKVDEADMVEMAAEMVADIAVEVENEVSPSEDKRRSSQTKEEQQQGKRIPATLRTI